MSNAARRLERETEVKKSRFIARVAPVSSREEVKDWLDQAGIEITEGIHRLGPRRITLFIRDPDRNVLEFNQLLPETE